MIRSLGLAASLFAGAVLFTGCTTDEQLHDVSGTITHDGKPIPKGLIFFDPDAAKGTTGLQGFANIEGGHFDTALPGKGKGIRGGTYSVRILAFDGKEAPESPFGKGLFPEHQFTKEFPSQKQTFDYDVKKGK